MEEARETGGDDAGKTRDRSDGGTSADVAPGRVLRPFFADLTLVVPAGVALVLDACLFGLVSSPASLPWARPGSGTGGVDESLSAAVADVMPLALACVVLHAVASVAVHVLLRLSVGRGSAALFGGVFYAVAPAHVHALASPDPLSPLLGALLVAVSMALAVAVRRRDWFSALAYVLALLAHPMALPAPVVGALARRRFPFEHALVVVVLVAAMGSFVLTGGSLPALPRASFAEVDLLLRGTAENAGEALSLGGATGIAVLALALAAAVAKGPLPRRASIWCGAFVLFAIPWGVLLGRPRLPAPGSALAAVVALSALAAEASLALRRIELPEWASPVVEAAVLALQVIAATAALRSL